MRLVIPSVAALLFLAAIPADAPAQGLGPILGPIVGPVDSLLRRGVRRALRPYVYRPRVYRPRARSPASSRSGVAQSPQRQIAQGEAAQPQPFWPDAPQDVFDFVLLSEGAGLWAHGYGAMVVSMFAQSTIPAEARGGAQLAASDTTGQAAGAASGDDEMICGERDIVRAEETIKDLSAELAIADDQRAVLTELRSALRRAEDEMIVACPYSIPATLPERLRTMQDRLWAIRVTVTNLRAPLQNFQDSLTAEQKAKLDGQRPSPRESKREPSPCHALTQQSPQWPAEETARAIRPDKDRQAALEILSKTSSQMGLMMMGACPQKMPATTPLARLDSTLDWLDAMLFAGVNVAADVDGFYRGLTKEQKAKLDKLDL